MLRNLFFQINNHYVLKNKGFFLRVTNSICNSFGNLILSLIAILIPENGDLITICLVISVLINSMSTTQWERENQRDKSNSILFDILLIFMILFVQLIFNVTTDFKLSLIELLLFIVFLLANANFNILHLSILVKGNILKTVIGFLLKILIPLLIFCLSYFVFEQNFTLYILSLAIFWGISFLILVSLDGFDKKLSNTKINQESIIINIVEFIRGQSWIFLSAAYSSFLSISQVYFLRQLLSPIGLLLASKRAAIFDEAIKTGNSQINLIKKARETYFKVFVFVLCLFILLFLFEKLYSLVLFFWVTLIFVQDIRAYQNRVKIINFSSGLIMLFIALFPLLILFYLNDLYLKIDLIYNIPAMVIGEILIIYYLKKIPNDEKFH